MNLKLTFKWLGNFKILWWFLFAVVASVAIADHIGCRIDVPRFERLPYAGWALEMLGVLVVFFGIGDKLRLFEKDGLIARAIKTLSEFPLFRVDTNVIAGSANLKIGGMKVRARGTVGPPADASIEDKVAFLLERANSLYNTILDVQDATTDKIDEIKKRLDADFASIREEVDSVRQQSEKAHVGHLGWEYAGLTWIMLGLTLATVPKLVLWIVSPLVRFFEWIPCK